MKECGSSVLKKKECSRLCVWINGTTGLKSVILFMLPLPCRPTIYGRYRFLKLKETGLQSWNKIRVTIDQVFSIAALVQHLKNPGRGESHLSLSLKRPAGFNR